MAKLSRDDVLKLAQLARLKLTDDELDHYAKEITAILTYVEQLSKVNVEAVAATNQVTGLSNVWREDKVEAYGYEPKSLLKNSPKVKEGYLQVGRMVE